VIIFVEAGSKTATYISFIGLFSLVFTTLLGVFFHAIEVAQQLLLILFLKDNLPLNLQQMLDYLKNYEVSFLFPKIFQHSVENEDPTSKFSQNDISPLFLDNAFFLIIISFCVPWILVILMLILRKFARFFDRHKKCKRLLTIFDSLTIFNLFFMLFQNSTQEISLFTVLQLKNIQLSNTFNILSFVFCIVYSLVNLLMIFWLYKLIKQIISSEKKNCS